MSEEPEASDPKRDDGQEDVVFHLQFFSLSNLFLLHSLSIGESLA